MCERGGAAPGHAAGFRQIFSGLYRLRELFCLLEDGVEDLDVDQHGFGDNQPVGL